MFWSCVRLCEISLYVNFVKPGLQIRQQQATRTTAYIECRLTVTFNEHLVVGNLWTIKVELSPVLGHDSIVPCLRCRICQS